MAYNDAPAVKTLLMPGKAFYSFGSFNDRVADGRLYISKVARATSVATITVQLLEGNAPAVGDLITVQGTIQASGAFNVSRVAVASVTLSANGAGTITYAVGSGTLTATADAGLAICEQVEQLVAFPSNDVSGVECGLQSFTGAAAMRPSGITWATKITGTPDSVSIQLQGATLDRNSEFVTIDASTSVSGESRVVAAAVIAGYNVLRVRMHSVVNGSSPKLMAKIQY